MNFSKKKVVVLLIIIGSISFAFKLYTTNYSLFPASDNLLYTLWATAFSHGDYAFHPKENPGWPLFFSPFFLLLDSNNFLDYANITRTLSLALLSMTILPMYLLARKFFDEKYSLVAASLFAFEPHINYISSLGLTESLYIPVMIGVFYFILNKNDKYAYLSFLLVGILWWIRLNGIFMFLIISIIFFLNFRKSPNLILKYAACVAIILVVISPILIQRYEQYGDPLYYYYGQSFFVEDVSMINAKNFKERDMSAVNYIQENGLPSFIHKFIVVGLYNILEAFIRILFPYLIILFPVGAILSFRASEQHFKQIRANWILILITLTTLIIPFSLVPERRYLYPLFPFLILFSTIAIQKVAEHDLKPFSFFTQKKKIFLLIIMIGIVISSGLFTLRYEKPDVIEEQEKLSFAKFLIKNFNGKIMGGGYVMESFIHAKLDDPPGIFKTFKMDRSKIPDSGFPFETGTLIEIGVYGKTLEEMISNGEEYGLRYIAINEKKGITLYKFLEDVYENEKKYPYLVKVFDPDEEGFQKFRVKVFEIDYETFHQTHNLHIG